jgi:hypothetical protein
MRPSGNLGPLKTGPGFYQTAAQTTQAAVVPRAPDGSACRSVRVPLAINKPFECRSAVLLSPSFRPMVEGYIRCGAGPPSLRQRGNRGWGLEEAWQP